jgi:hypothetical protein
MKKYLVLLLCTVLILSMAACGENSDGQATHTNNPDGTQDITIENSTGLNDDNENEEIVFAEEIAVDSSLEFDRDNGLTTFSTFETQTIFKNDKYELIAESIEYNDLFCIVNFKFMNNTDEPANCSTLEFAINDWMMFGTMFAYVSDVPPHSEGTFSWDIPLGQFQIRHIDTINCFKAIFIIEDYYTDILTWSTDAENMCKKYVFDGTPVYDKNNILAIIPKYGAATRNINYYVENNTDEIMRMDCTGKLLTDDFSYTYRTWDSIAFPHTKVIPSLELNDYKFKPGDIYAFVLTPEVTKENADYLSFEEKEELIGDYYKLIIN